MGLLKWRSPLACETTTPLRPLRYFAHHGIHNSPIFALQIRILISRGGFLQLCRLSLCKNLGEMGR